MLNKLENQSFLTKQHSDMSKIRVTALRLIRCFGHSLLSDMLTSIVTF